MAEELDIRSIWNKGKAQEDPSSIHINMMEKKGTKTTLYWIKTILWIEFWINAVIIGPAVYYMINRGDQTWFIVMCVVITCIYLFYYQFLIKQIKKFSYDGNVIQSLKKVYGYLWFYLLHYKVVIWLSLLVGVVMGYYDPNNLEAMQKIDTTKEWLLFIGIVGLMVGIIGGFFHLVVHLIYGRKIKRLKRTVKDLEREE